MTGFLVSTAICIGSGRSYQNQVVFRYNVCVPETLLQTKLYTPPLRPNLIPRPRLLERLNQGLQQGCKLSLVCAPAGFGKTTLVAEWISSLRLEDDESPIQNLKSEIQIAWLLPR